MIKDPLNTQETIYEILEIEHNTPMQEVHQALPRFMKKNKAVSKISIAQDLIRKLKSVPDRLELDITYYAIEDMEPDSLESYFNIAELLNSQLSELANITFDLKEELLVNCFHPVIKTVENDGEYCLHPTKIEGLPIIKLYPETRFSF